MDYIHINDHHHNMYDAYFVDVWSTYDWFLCSHSPYTDSL